MNEPSPAWTDRVRSTYVDALGDEVTVAEGFGPVAADVPPDRWVQAVTLARDGLGCAFFDWLSAVDELGDGFRVVCHVASHRPGTVHHLVLRTLVPRTDAALGSVGDVFAGARWHERETHEMFGISFTSGGEVLEMEKLLLPEEFEGHPLRKEFVLASRVAKAWPGAKEPGESDAGHAAAPARRRTRPPGAPEPEQWGPREPGSQAPDPLAVAESAPARPRRAPRQSPSDEGSGDG